MLQSLSPGMVETEMVPEEYLKINPALKAEDIAAGVLYILGAPPHVQVRNLYDDRLYSDFPRSFHVTPCSRVLLQKLTVAKMDKFHYHSHKSPHLS